MLREFVEWGRGEGWEWYLGWMLGRLVRGGGRADHRRWWMWIEGTGNGFVERV